MPNFFRKEHNALAKCLKSCQPLPIMLDDRRQHYSDCLALCKMLMQDNPLFNKNLFLKECGYPEKGNDHVPGDRQTALPAIDSGSTTRTISAPGYSL